MDKKGYAGTISHSGTQTVKAPLPGTSTRKSGSVVKGKDLRTGK